MTEAKQEFDRIDSIEVKMNAKQECSWAIKLYYNNEEQVYTDVVDKLEAIHVALKERFL